MHKQTSSVVHSNQMLLLLSVRYIRCWAPGNMFELQQEATQTHEKEKGKISPGEYA
jgi:hypothetical protein